MPETINSSAIDVLMERASESLAQMRYFEAERLCVKAIGMARSRNDFDRMARIVMPLQESRRQRREQALDASDIIVMDDTPISEEMEIAPGPYLVQPPLVGADTRRLRLEAFHREIPVTVLCREPITRIKLWPIVAICPGVTVRTKVLPPDNPGNPDMPWYVQTMEDIGEAAIASIDPEMDVQKRVDSLLARLDAIPDHERLHHVLEETCREAQHALGLSSE